MIDPERKDIESVVETPDNWTNVPTLEDFKGNFTSVLSSQQSQIGKIKQWRKDYNNKPVTLDKRRDKTSSTLTSKLVKKQAEWRIPGLSDPYVATDKLFSISPVTFEDVERSKQNELLINNQFSTKINKVQFFNKLTRSLVRDGTVILKTHWVNEVDIVEKEVPIIDYVIPIQPELVVQKNMQLMQLQQAQPDIFNNSVPDEVKEALRIYLETGQPVTPVSNGVEIIEEEKVVKNHPDAEVCDIDKIYIDPTCNGVTDDIGFFIHEITTTLSDLKSADGIYTNLDNIELQASTPVSTNHDGLEDDNISGFRFDDTPRKKLIMYEYWGSWDYDDSGVAKPVVCSWIGDTIIRLEENPYPDKKLPFIVIPYTPLTDSVYGEPDAVLLKDNQDITSAVTRAMIDLVGKSANSQTGMAKDFLSIAERQKYLRGDDYTFSRQNGTPADSIFQHKFPELPESGFRLVAMQNQEAESLTGIKSFASGITSQSLGETATGVKGALSAESLRKISIIRNISEGITEIGRRFIAMNSVFLSEEEVVRVTNSKFVSVRRDDLDGSYDLVLNISTLEEDNMRAQELSFMLQTIGNSMGMDMKQMILSEIALLRNMPDFSEKILNFKQEPDPVQQQIQQLELEKLKAEIEEIRSRSTKNMAEAGEKQTDSELTKAKTVTESQKADNIKSDTDRKDLDYLQEEKGVNQARELEKQELIAKNNMRNGALSSMLQQKGN